MAFIEDLTTKTYCPWAHEGVWCFSVGWLGNSVPQTGNIAPHVLSFLHYYAQHYYREDGFLGYHTCEICGRVKSHGEFWIEMFDPLTDLDVRFVLPVGIFHYIDAHGYCPPSEFLAAIEPLARKFKSGSA